jgi:hypothetical protein
MPSEQAYDHVPLRLLRGGRHRSGATNTDVCLEALHDAVMMERMSGPEHGGRGMGIGTAPPGLEDYVAMHGTASIPLL